MTRFFRRFVPFGLLLAAALPLAACSSSADRAQSYYKSGNDYVTKGDLVKASLEFKNALKLKSDLLDARFALAQVEERQNDYADAAKDYGAVAEQDPKNVPARVRLAYILIAAGQMDQAAKLADEASAIAPNDPTVLVVRAAIALKQGKHPDAVDLAKAALKVSPGMTDALMVLASERLAESDPKGALTYLDQANDKDDSNASIQILRLVALDAAGDQPGVEQLFKKLIDLYPNNPGFSQGLVRWYLGKGRADDAEALMRQIAAKSPADDQAQLSLVAFVNSRHGADAAITELKSIIAQREQGGSDDFALKMSLAQLQYGASDKAAALDEMSALVDATKDSKQKNQARVQWARMLSGQNQADKAEKLVDAVIADDAGNVDALNVRASLRMVRGDAEDAIQDLLTALNQAPDDAGIHGLLAEAYERVGSTSLAEEQYAKAMDLGQDTPQTGLPYARFLLRFGKTDQAERALETIAQKAPNDRDTLSLLAQVRLSLNDWAGAQQVADALRKVDEGKSDPTADQIAAAAFTGQNDFTKSIGLLQSAMADETNQQGKAQVLPDLVATYIRAGKQQDAETYLASIIDKDPTDVQARILLARVYTSEGKAADAETALKAAVDQDKGVEAQLTLAQFYMSSGNLDDAETTAKAAVTHDPGSTAGRLLLAAIYEQTQQFDDAIAQYEELFKQDPSSVVVANDLASLLSERRGDKASLDRAYDIAQRLAGSEVPQYLDTLGWIDHLRGDEASALAALKAASAGLPNVALVQYHLGVVLAALGQTDLAKQTLQKAVTMTPPLIEADLAKAKAAIDQLNAPAPAPGATEG